MHPTIAPVKKAKYKPTIMPGNPKTNPIKNANFTSPKPIPRPFVPINNAKKNKHAPKAERKLETINCGALTIKYTTVINIAGKIILSGIMPYLRSAKNTAIKQLTINR